MSRCFPFPPTEYVRNFAHDEDLVESTKKDVEVATKEIRKEKKKEKKEKRKERKERKENEKSYKDVDGYRKKVDDHKLGHQCYSKQIEDETEQLEKSGLTEEHEQPQNQCYLSDGSQSNKRKRQESPKVQSQNQGEPLRIRFVFKKSKESKALQDKERLYLTLGAEGVTSNEKIAQFQVGDTRTNTIASTSAPELDEKKSSSGISINPQKNPKLNIESQYKALFEDWVPHVPSFQSNDEEDDQEWLFGRRKQREDHAVKRVKTEDLNLSCGDSSWPQAQFLPHVGIYSLPYTIPF